MRLRHAAGSEAVVSEGLQAMTTGFCDEITVMILTYNEENNIARTLDAVKWAKHILVVDSGSTDRTLEIVRGYPQARLMTRAFDDVAQQSNFGLDHVETAWVLSLDADYQLSAALQREIECLQPAEDIGGYRVSFNYCIDGRRLRSTIYPPRTVLFRPLLARYRNEGHAIRIDVAARVEDLAGRINHDDRKPLGRWLASQMRYVPLEADYLLATPRVDLNRNARIRLMAWPAPILVFFYTLIAKRCILDGWAGWLYVLQRVLAETMIALEIVDRRLRAKGASQASAGTSPPVPPS